MEEIYKKTIQTKIAIINVALKKNQKKEIAFEKQAKNLDKKRHKVYLDEKNILLKELESLQNELQAVNQEENLTKNQVENSFKNDNQNLAF